MKPKTVERLRRILDAPELPGGRYRILAETGRGGMGAVYRAEDTELGREVALKVLNIENEDAAGLMGREARILAGLEHPGIVPVHDVGTLADGRAFYVMKFVRGQRLDEYQRGGHSPAERLRLFQRLCEPLAFAHQRGVVHRDLKPENIMVGEFGEVLVLDWGIAKLAGEPDAHAVLGTKAYMAPEQAAPDASAVDARADVYALGRILLFLLGGGPVARPVAAIAAKASDPQPSNRYPSALELGRDIERFLDGLPVEAYREPWFDRIRRVVSRHKALLALIAAYLVMRAVVFWFTGR